MKKPLPKKTPQRAREAAGTDLQTFALTMLLVTPSTLQSLWLSTADDAVWRPELTRLGFTNVDGAADFMARLRNRRMFLEGVGTLLQELGEYPEPPPHPPNGKAREIVTRLA